MRSFFMIQLFTWSICKKTIKQRLIHDGHLKNDQIELKEIEGTNIKKVPEYF